MTFANLSLLPQARRNLSLYVLHRAASIARTVGFGYIDSPDAHASNYVEILAKWAESKHTGLAFPVWSEHSDKTIYTSSGANYAFRFWHDALHATQSLDFSLESEVRIGMSHVIDVQAEFGHESLEALLMYADTIEMSLYAATNSGAFPDDQYAFVIRKVAHYIEAINSTKPVSIGL